MDRRKFLIGSGATLAAVAGLSKAENAFAENTNPGIPEYSAGNMDSNPQPLATQSNDLSPFPTNLWTDQTLRHLLRRAMLGVPLAQFQAAQTLSSMTAVVAKLLTDQPLPAKPAAYLDQIAPPDAGDLTQFGKLIAAQDATSLELTRSNQVADWWMDLILQENLSITEHMTLLWSNHFVIGSDVVKPAGYLYTYNQTLRANALGNMKTFVKAVSIDPAMLIYLNGNQNFDGVVPGGTKNEGLNINENYARELQELFTLGLNDPVSGLPNYSENDVQQAAKALTGWAPTTTAPFDGVFYPNSHNNDQKTYLGQTGNWALDDIINIIFTYKGPGGNTRPGFNTAYWFCQKIYMEFVYYVPNTSVITAMANMMLDSNWDIKPVLSALLQSAHFYDPLVQNAQLKSPVNFIASLVREFGLTYIPFNSADVTWDGTSRTSNNIKIYTDPNVTLSYMTVSSAYGASSIGEQLLQPPNVKGWPGGHNWISTGTFQQRETDSNNFLLNPPGLDGSTKVKGVKIELASPTAWVQALPNFANLKSHDIAVALTTLVLNKTLGPLESGTLYLALNPQSLPDSDFYLVDKDIANFAIALAQLPEFQLV